MVVEIYLRVSSLREKWVTKITKTTKNDANTMAHERHHSFSKPSLAKPTLCVLTCKRFRNSTEILIFVVNQN